MKTWKQMTWRERGGVLVLSILPTLILLIVAQAAAHVVTRRSPPRSRAVLT